MAAKDTAPLVEPPRTITELEAELERRTAERDEALARESAVAEVLGVINSSPGDLAPVFDAMLDRAARLCEAALGHLLVYDGRHFRLAATRGVSQEYADFLHKNPSIGPPGSDLSRLIAGENIVHRTDFKPEALPATAHARTFAELGGAKTSLLVALRKDGLLLGAVTVYRQEVRAFSDNQIALLESLRRRSLRWRIRA